MTVATAPRRTAPTLSPAASSRLERELASLVEERQLRATEPIDATGDAADLAEFAARDMLLERLDTRISSIRGLLAEASLPRPRDAVEDAGAEPGTVIELRFGSSRTVETMLLGHLAEADGEFEVVTPESPLGRALLGAKPGSTVRYAAPRGDLDVTVVAIRAA